MPKNDGSFFEEEVQQSDEQTPNGSMQQSNKSEFFDDQYLENLKNKIGSSHSRLEELAPEPKAEVPEKMPTIELSPYSEKKQDPYDEDEDLAVINIELNKRFKDSEIEKENDHDSDVNKICSGSDDGGYKKLNGDYENNISDLKQQITVSEQVQKDLVDRIRKI